MGPERLPVGAAILLYDDGNAGSHGNPRFQARIVLARVQPDGSLSESLVSLDNLPARSALTTAFEAITAALAAPDVSETVDAVVSVLVGVPDQDLLAEAHRRGLLPA